MSTIARGRLIPINETVFDQADFFQVDGFTRLAGLTVSDLAATLFYNNVVQPWPLVNGAPVPNSQVKAGSVYLHEIAGAAGYYSLRFRPNAAGYWRLMLVYAAGQQRLSQDYDVTAPSQIQGGLTASFTNC